ncbi:MAG: hypothetical protein ACOX50_02430 [Patescibacteria group bacterium]|jgi:hypothetical protein
MAKSDSLLSWSYKLNTLNPQLAQKLLNNKTKGIKALETLQLPRYYQVKISLPEFLKTPDYYLEMIKTEKYYINLPPNFLGLDRFYKIGLLRDEVLTFVKESIPLEKANNYQILVSEYFDNLFAGNIIITKDQDFLLELVEGDHGLIVFGKKKPDFIITRNPYTGFFKCSFADPRLKNVLRRTILSIPHWQEENKLYFNPGYYEFVIHLNEENSLLEPKFLDYVSNPIYTVPETENYYL